MEAKSKSGWFFTKSYGPAHYHHPVCDAHLPKLPLFFIYLFILTSFLSKLDYLCRAALIGQGDQQPPISKPSNKSKNSFAFGVHKKAVNLGRFSKYLHCGLKVTVNFRNSVNDRYRL